MVSASVDMPQTAWEPTRTTALSVLADGTVIGGRGAGATGSIQAEVCFNTAITGYQEILTDPSYAGQIITFTFPHIGNVGANPQDLETLDGDTRSGVAGAIFKADITSPSNYRSAHHFDDWLKHRNIIAMSGVDTRALTNLIRQKGLTNAVIAHHPDGQFDVEALKRRAAEWAGLEGADLAKKVTTSRSCNWHEGAWQWNKGFASPQAANLHIVAVDFGVKRNILRLLVSLGSRVTVVPATASAKEILAHQPDGIFLSNGPGDPAATGEYSVPVIRALLKTDIPIFGICLGHEMLALALGAKTIKMHQGHHGANHPVKDHTTGKVEIVSMNHGFAVDSKSLPESVEETHVSLFDGSNCGLQVKGKPVFSVQHHPEASPGPQDSHYLFDRFLDTVRARTPIVGN